MVREHVWFAGVDWASEGASRLRGGYRGGVKKGECTFRHTGARLAQMADWIMGPVGGGRPRALPWQSRCLTARWSRA